MGVLHKLKENKYLISILSIIIVVCLIASIYNFYNASKHSEDVYKTEYYRLLNLAVVSLLILNVSIVILISYNIRKSHTIIKQPTLRLIVCSVPTIVLVLVSLIYYGESIEQSDSEEQNKKILIGTSLLLSAVLSCSVLLVYTYRPLTRDIIDSIFSYYGAYANPTYSNGVISPNRVKYPNSLELRREQMERLIRREVNAM
jgi:hypothetical protein